MPFFQAQSLLDRGSTTIPQTLQFGNLYGAFDRHGQPRAAYPAGQAFLSLPLLLVGKFVLTHLPGVPPTWEAVFYMQVFGAVLTSAIFAASSMAFFFLTLSRLNVSIQSAALVTLCVAFGTLLFPYSGYFFSEPFTASILMAAVFVVSHAGEPLSVKRGSIAGLLLASAVWIRPTMILATGVFVAGVLLRDGKIVIRRAAIMSVIPAVSGLLYLLSNKIVFGSAFNFGYPETEEMLGKHLNSFHTPFYVGLEGFLLSPGKSIFIFMPLLILAIIGAGRLWVRERAVATISIGLPILYLLFYMGYTQWEGGFCPGPRYLLPFLLITCLAIGPLVDGGERRFRSWLLVLAAVGFAVQVITYSTSFLENQAIGHGDYYDSKLNYRMAYDSLVVQTKALIAYSKGKPAPVGLGFDRWFVFLHKLGIAAYAEVLIAVVPTLVLVLSMVRLRQLLRTKRRAMLDLHESAANVALT
jgi:hypothetical protein